MNDFLRVGAVQATMQEADEAYNLQKTLDLLAQAEDQQIDILSTPECFLHGYFNNKKAAYANAIDLSSTQFKKLCKAFAPYKKTTLLLGLNEIDNANIYNTVIVIENGECKGKYRKAYTYPPYDYYSLGRDFPIFEKKGVKFGIIICLDSAYREPAQITALKGAQVIFCPSFNRVDRDARMLHYLSRKSHFISRAFDNQSWLVVSDIVSESAVEVCAGYSCIISDSGEIVAKAEPFQETILSYAIPLVLFEKRKLNRIYGNKELFEILVNTYRNFVF